MNIKMKYGSDNITFEIPKGIKIVNNLPDKFEKKMDIKNIKNIIHFSLIKLFQGKADFINKKIALIIEDITRPTYLGEVAKIIIEELMELGAEKSFITIISASGAHRPMNQIDFEKKVGRRLAYEIRCISNDCESSNFSYLGKVSKGIPLYINRHVTEADFKITVSTIFPHDMAGFSGGAKMILPGVANLKSIIELHRLNSNIFSYGSKEIPKARYIIEEAGDRLGVELSISLIINKELDIISIHSGNFRTSQRKATKKFNEIYGVADVQKTDIVISNCYPLGLDLYLVEKGLFPALFFAKNNAKILFFSPCEERVGFHRVVDHNGVLRKFAISYFANLTKKYDISFFSNGVTESEFHEYFPRFNFFNDIDDCCSYLFERKKISEKSLSLLTASPLIVAGNISGGRV